MPAALVVAPGTEAVVAVTDGDVADPTTGGSGGTGGTGGADGSGGDGDTDGSTDALGSSGATFYGTLPGLLATALGTDLAAFSRRRRA